MCVLDFMTVDFVHCSCMPSCRRTLFFSFAEGYVFFILVFENTFEYDKCILLFTKYEFNVCIGFYDCGVCALQLHAFLP